MMKTKVSLITLFACAAAGSSLFAAAYRQDSGSHTNSGTEVIYTGNEVWGSDSKAVYDSYLKDLAESHGMNYSWNESEQALYDGNSYWSIDTPFLLSGTAQYTNNARYMNICYAGDRTEEETASDGKTIENERWTIIAGNAKFTNNGEFWLQWDEDINRSTAPRNIVMLRDNAVFENAGLISSDYSGSYGDGNLRPALNNFTLFGNAKLINKASGEIHFQNGENSPVNEEDFFIVNLHDNSSFENAGMVRLNLAQLAEGGSFINTGKVYNKGGHDYSGIEILFNQDWAAGTAKVENRGTMEMSDVRFEFESGFNSEASALVENYGTWSKSSSGGDIYFRVETTGKDSVNLQVKNYGTFAGNVQVDSLVALTLSDTSKINGNLHFGSSSSNVKADVDTLTIELTGGNTGESLIGGNVTLANTVDVNVSFSDSALASVFQDVYTVTLWSGALTGSFGTTEGTTNKWDIDYSWSLNNSGVLTVQADLGEIIEVTDSTANVDLSNKNDIAKLDGLPKYSGEITGAGVVSYAGESGDVLTFSGDASAHTGTTLISGGTFSVTEEAKLGTGEISVAAGTLRFTGTRAVENAITGAGTVEIASNAKASFSNFNAKTLLVNGTLQGNFALGSVSDAAIALNGTLQLNVNADEKVSLNGGKVVIARTARLSLSDENAGAASVIGKLESGEKVVIFEGGEVEGDVASFLGTDAGLSDAAAQYTVLYSADSGLQVQVLQDASALSGDVNTSGFSSSFVRWAMGGTQDTLENLGVGFQDAGDLSLDDPLMNALLSGNATAARSILERLSPKSYAAMIAMPTEAFNADVRSISARLAQTRATAFDQNSPWEFFAQAQMTSVDNDDAHDSPTFDFDTYGVLAGAMYRLDATTAVGLSLGADEGEAKIHNNGGKIESTDFRLTGYATKAFEAFYVNAGAQVGFASYDVKRRTDYGKANGDTDGWNAGVFAEVGSKLTLSEENKLFATPYVGLAYLHSSVDSFTESGSDAAFDVDSFSGESLRGRIGCEISWGFALGGTAMRLGLDVAYAHEFLDDEIDIDVKPTDGGGKISETAQAFATDVFSVSPTLNVDLTETASVFVGYAFNASTDSSTTHSANAGVRLRF